MKKTLILSLLILSTTKISAQGTDYKRPFNLRFDTRFDMQSDLKDGSDFRGQTVKIVIDGQIYPGIRYMFRHKINNYQTPLKMEDFNAATNFAFVEFDVSKSVTLRLGKQAVQLGTFEYNNNPADLYIFTDLNEDYECYQMGLNMALKLSGQVYNFQIAKASANHTAESKYANRSFGGLFVWEGSLFDDLLKTRYGIGAFQRTPGNFLTRLTLGTQLNIGNFTFEADYYNIYRKGGFVNLDGQPGSFVFADTDNNGKIQNRDLSFFCKYTKDKISPFIRVNFNKRKDTQSGIYYNKNVYMGGIEYRPFTSDNIKNLRFHAVYGYTDKKYTNVGIETQRGHTLIVGMRWLINAY